MPQPSFCELEIVCSHLLRERLLRTRISPLRTLTPLITISVYGSFVEEKKLKETGNLDNLFRSNWQLEWHTLSIILLTMLGLKS
jgi:hypothetical protein